MTLIDIQANTQKVSTTSSITVWGVKAIVQACLGIYIAGDLESSSNAGVPMPAIAKIHATHNWAYRFQKNGFPAANEYYTVDGLYADFPN